MKINELKTPCYVIDEGKLTENLKILHHVMQRTGAKILLAQKAFSAFCEYPLIGKYLSGTTASGLYEARLAQEEMGKENHVFCPAYLPEEMDELVKICDHIVFNSVSQFLVHKEKIKEAAAGVSTGLRINPECSTQEGHEIYDPCGTGSRLGITRAELDKAIQNGFDLSQIDGFHFHTLCEQNSDALETTLDAVEKKFGDLLYGRKWLNMGGGHHITKAGYDMEKRKKYDEYGEHWKHADEFEKQKQQYGAGGFGGRTGGFGSSGNGSYWYSSNGEEGFGDAGGFGGNAGGFSDFFEELFGHRGAGAGSRRGAGFRGQDYNAELQLSLREAAVTHKQVLNVNGKNIRITVPAGIANGQTIKLRGHGAPGVNGGPDGDLYITFIIPDDPVFKRLGNDLYVTAPLNLYTAVLGGEETVDTLDGKVKLKVKPETQNGTKVRLKGKGFPVYKEEGKFGDLIVTYNITIPTNLTEHQKELFRQLKNSIN